MFSRLFSILSGNDYQNIDQNSSIIFLQGYLKYTLIFAFQKLKNVQTQRVRKFPSLLNALLTQNKGREDEKYFPRSNNELHNLFLHSSHPNDKIQHYSTSRNFCISVNHASFVRSFSCVILIRYIQFKPSILFLTSYNAPVLKF